MVRWNVERQKHKIGDIVKINIRREITSCIVLSDFVPKKMLSVGTNYVDYYDYDDYDYGYTIHIVKADPFFLFDCCQLLIGDRKVYAEYDEIMP